jgi:kinesin family protein 6/9
MKAMQDEIKRLQLLVQQRDNEILIFLNMLKSKQETPDSSSTVVFGSSNNKPVGLQISQETTSQVVFPEFDRKIKQTSLDDEEEKASETKKKFNDSLNLTRQSAVSQKVAEEKALSGRREPEPANESRDTKDYKEVNNLLTKPMNITPEMVKNRALCFEMFRKSYRKSLAIEEDQLKLKELMERGKEEAKAVKKAKESAEKLMKKLEEVKIQRGLMGLSGDGSGKSSEEEQIQEEMRRQKQIYVAGLEELKTLKAEVNAMQTHITHLTMNVQRDFDKWFGVAIGQIQPPSKPQNLGDASFVTTATVSKGNNGINASFASNSTKTSKPKDKEVEKSLTEFYKARDAIYNS